MKTGAAMVVSDHKDNCSLTRTEHGQKWNFLTSQRKKYHDHDQNHFYVYDHYYYIDYGFQAVNVTIKTKSSVLYNDLLGRHMVLGAMNKSTLV